MHLYLLCTNHEPHFPRPPTLPPKPQRMRKCRPRSIFNRKLFNGNMEAFIQVLARLRSLCLHELSCLASSPWKFSCLCPHSFTRTLAHSRADFPLALLACLHTAAQFRKYPVRWESNQAQVQEVGLILISTAVQQTFLLISFFLPRPPQDTELIWLHGCHLATHQPC